jgi:hypothetical protein
MHEGLSGETDAPQLGQLKAEIVDFVTFSIQNHAHSPSVGSCDVIIVEGMKLPGFLAQPQRRKGPKKPKESAISDI